MLGRKIKILSTLALPLFAAGCVSTSYSAKDAGFLSASLKAGEATGKQTVWVQNQQHAQVVRDRVKTLMAKKTIDVETAVQVALLNNKGLQAAYSDLGDSAADAWQTQLSVFPTFSVGLSGIGTPGLEAYRVLEGAIAANILALATYDKNIKLAETRFRQAQLNAALATISLAADTRRAWVNAVAAWENVAYLNRARAAAEAASDLTQKLGEAGSMPKGNQAREHVFYAELTADAAKAKLSARLAKEELIRLMGLSGTDIEFQIPNRLPSLPKALIKRNDIEAEAIHKRMDLQVARLELQALAQSYKLDDATRFVTDIELVGTVEKEREREDHGIVSEVSRTASLEFTIPIFDSGQARLRKGELAYMRAANQLAELAVNVRSEARSAYQAYRANYDIARHYRNNVLPLRNAIDEQSLLTYNGMLTSTFELISDSRDSINSTLLAVNAKRDFWLAEANLAPALYGGSAGAPSGETEVASAEAAEGGGH
ncbi:MULTISPECIES: TolC family protein [Pseudorhizobium]|uniref:Outer membrane protein TolC n=2 Tax=Pseudorhizobium TaxID=1903858 RepID=A0A7W9Z2D9_9HYPH|nr:MULTISPECIES: TolC family protein [Pseudorhizobium]MBU1312808.1 TolC family protein [Alphaproteobacteria bacterium]MBB6181891.1 outer membrane protein TolC [Pseudorhizobium flavum]MBU1551986.1 TolC family protein [Alphaproteobacteria bacterium]MBU2337533.1 TolC family protein [Alphaproteobacteria bacterium]MBU2388174.1 TolC family protein [Alphaproteobacteria bacterium]|tara:strand:- start:28 stop:1488 length:1461 start_codon:yes stop_codon:yes gene_type:complete